MNTSGRSSISARRMGRTRHGSLGSRERSLSFYVVLDTCCLFLQSPSLDGDIDGRQGACSAVRPDTSRMRSFWPTLLEPHEVIRASREWPEAKLATRGRATMAGGRETQGRLRRRWLRSGSADACLNARSCWKSPHSVHSAHTHSPFVHDLHLHRPAIR